MTFETVTLRLSRRLLSDANSVAAGQDVTIGHLVRHLLAKEIDRRLGPRTNGKPDENLVAAVDVLLTQEMSEADGWDDLAARLVHYGFELRPDGDDISLHKRFCGTHVCKGSDLGFAYRTLVRRFGCGMHGHPRGTLGEVFGEDEVAQHNLNSTRKGRLQRSLGPVFKTAPDWDTLTYRLQRRGYVLRPQGTGLAIYDGKDGSHLCNTATVGYRYRALVKQFGAPMPGHTHGMKWVKTSRQPEQDEPEFDVIDRDWRILDPQTQNAPALGRGV